MIVSSENSTNNSNADNSANSNSSNSSNNTDEDEYEIEIASLIYKIFTVIFLLVGTVTNLISALIYSKKKMRQRSYSIYLFVLAVVDIMVTWVGNARLALMFYEWQPYSAVSSQRYYDPNEYWRGFDIRDTSIYICRVHKFFTYFLLQFSSLLLCMLNIDRFFGCVLVLKASIFCKPIVARRLVILTFFFLFLVNMHFLIAMGDSSTPTRYTYINGTIENDINANKSQLHRIREFVCQPDPSKHVYSFFFYNIYFYLDGAIYCIIPFFIMIVCNFLIIFKIKQSRINSKQVIMSKKPNIDFTYNIRKNRSSMLASERRLSIILVGISISFLILTIPVFIMENLDHLGSFNEQKFWKVGMALSYMMMYSNHVINFFFYCLLGPKFRSEVKKLIPFCFRKKNKVHPLKLNPNATYVPVGSAAAQTRRNKSNQINANFYSFQACSIAVSSATGRSTQMKTKLTNETNNQRK
jgi:hypothetical protein